MNINPIKLLGNWDEGYALDKHAISSIPLGEDVFGHMQFDTTRSEIGELLYYFKYRNKYDNLCEIIELAKPFLDSWKILKSVDLVLSVPSSNKDRLYQPAFEIAHEIAMYLKIPFADDVLQKSSSLQSKDMSYEEKQQLKGAITVTKKLVRRLNVLLVDDLYQTGVTLKECVNVLRKDLNVNKVYVLTVTKTKR